MVSLMLGERNANARTDGKASGATRTTLHLHAVAVTGTGLVMQTLAFAIA